MELSRTNRTYGTFTHQDDGPTSDGLFRVSPSSSFKEAHLSIYFTPPYHHHTREELYKRGSFITSCKKKLSKSFDFFLRK